MIRRNPQTGLISNHRLRFSKGRFLCRHSVNPVFKIVASYCHRPYRQKTEIHRPNPAFRIFSLFFCKNRECHPVVGYSFCFKRCHKLARWQNKTVGTITLGSQMKGKYVTPKFGWSNASFCIGPGNESIAIIKILNNSSKAKIFQTISRGRFVLPPRNAKK